MLMEMAKRFPSWGQSRAGRPPEIREKIIAQGVATWVQRHGGLFEIIKKAGDRGILVGPTRDIENTFDNPRELLETIS